MAAVVAAPASAALAPFYPTQSIGDRGTDVATIQELFLYHQTPRGSGSARGVTTGAINPIVVPIDGVFGALTAAGIRGFQAGRLLPETGAVDGATWDALVVPIGPGSTGHAVEALQRELRDKRGATTVPLDGIYGATTAAAVTAFQARMGLPQTGIANATTWRYLVWHYEQPRFSASALCDYDVVSHNWGTAETVAALEAAGSVMVKAGYGQIAVGDMSLELGGDTPLHVAHEVGLDADLRPMRKANDQCSHGSNWRLTAYDRSATRALIKAIQAATPGHVKFILFNDPQLIAEGLTRYLAGHDDHLHVHFCEAGHPDRDYRC
jgi:peptidoglycan hydrolase-like protein with peptidoglycan-binding domain